jgi:hypothetical protein
MDMEMNPDSRMKIKKVDVRKTEREEKSRSMNMDSCIESLIYSFLSSTIEKFFFLLFRL